MDWFTINRIGELEAENEKLKAEIERNSAALNELLYQISDFALKAGKQAKQALSEVKE